MDPASRAAGGFMPRFRFGPAAGGFSMATAASAPTAAAPSAAGGDEAPFAREGKAGHLLLDVGAVAARAGDRLAPGADVLLEALVAGVADVLVNGHRVVSAGGLGAHLLLGLLPILEELLEADVGERVLHEGGEDRIGHGPDVG